MWSWRKVAIGNLQTILSSVCGSYIEDLDRERVDYDLTKGQLQLKNVRLKKSSLDEFKLPVELVEGRIGQLSLSVSWENLGSKPVEMQIEDMYILIAPVTSSKINREDEERRSQALKSEKLRISRLFGGKRLTEQPFGFVISSVTKLVNNLQLTIKNIHIRYEDDANRPYSSFAAGITLSKLTVQSTDEAWIPTLIHNNFQSLHKLIRIESLAMYLDVDPPRTSDSFSPFDNSCPPTASNDLFLAERQFVVKGFTGEANIILNRAINVEPNIDIQLSLGDIHLVLNNRQYPHLITLLEMYHLYLRGYQYHQFHPDLKKRNDGRPCSLFKFAGHTILNEIREKRQRATFAFIERVGKNRRSYMALFRKLLLNQIATNDLRALDIIEFKLSYEDIQLYRTLARRQLREDTKAGELKTRSRQPEFNQGFLENGSFESDNGGSPEEVDPLGDHQEFSQREGGELRLRVAIEIEHAYFVLESRSPACTQDAKSTDIISMVFGGFVADVSQGPDALDGTFTLAEFRVFNAALNGSTCREIVHVEMAPAGASAIGVQANKTPFASHEYPGAQSLFFVFKHRLLGKQACDNLMVRTGHVEILYNKRCVEELYGFFRRPPGQVRLIEALLGVTLGPELLGDNTTWNLDVDLAGLEIVFPEDITTKQSRHLVFHAGRTTAEGSYVSKGVNHGVHAKLRDPEQLESRYFDNFTLKLERSRLLVGPDLNSCLQNLELVEPNVSFCIIEPIDIKLLMQISVAPGGGNVTVPIGVQLPRFKMSGRLPTLVVNFSDTKYKAIMKIIELSLPKLRRGEAESQPETMNTGAEVVHNAAVVPRLVGSREDLRPDHKIDIITVHDDEHETLSRMKDEDITKMNPRGLTFWLDFKVDALQMSISKSNTQGADEPLGVLRVEDFRLTCAVENLKSIVDIRLQSLAMTFAQAGIVPISLRSSDNAGSGSERDLMTIRFTGVKPEHPDFVPMHEGYTQDIKILLSTSVFRGALEPVVSLWSFILVTLAPEESSNPNQTSSEEEDNIAEGDIRMTPTHPNETRLALNLAKVQVLLDLNPEQHSAYEKAYFSKKS